MSRIDDLIAEYCPDGVEFKTLGEVGTFTRGNGLQKKDLLDKGTGAIHYGQIFTTYGTTATHTRSFVRPDLAAKLRQAQPGDLVIATTSENDEDVCKAVAWLGSDPIAISGDAYIYTHQLDPRYVAYLFQAELFQAQKRTYITGTKVRRVAGRDIAKIRVPVPPPPIQRKVAEILDKMEALQMALKSQLEDELKARKYEYVHYRGHLLGSPETQAARLTSIGDTFSLRAGKFIAASQISAVQTPETPYPCYGGGGLRGYVASANQHGEHVLIGRQGALCGNIKWAAGDFYATEHAVVVTPKADTDIRWTYHQLVHMNLNQYASKSAQPGLSVQVLNALMISLPEHHEQKRAAAILDKFDALVNDLTAGLPAEIAARRKQYEYYRDRLLTFEEKTA